MPLGFRDNRMACVVTPEVFDLPENTNGLNPPYDRVTVYVGGDNRKIQAKPER
jgi:hypothetical protein